jgi:hypothetical protein
VSEECLESGGHRLGRFPSGLFSRLGLSQICRSWIRLVSGLRRMETSSSGGVWDLDGEVDKDWQKPLSLAFGL